MKPLFFILAAIAFVGCSTNAIRTRAPAGDPVYCLSETKRKYFLFSVPLTVSREDRFRWSASHLAKLYTLTQKSLSDFDSTLKSGKTLEEIRSQTSIYARLWALRQLKEAFLEQLVLDYESQSQVLPDLRSTRESPTFVESKLMSEFTHFLNMMMGELKFQKYSDVDIQKILQDVKDLFEDKQEEILSCQQDRKVRTFQWNPDPRVYRSAVSLPAFAIEKELKKQTRRIKKDWSRLSRRPFSKLQNEEPKKVFPDIGPAGNVSGNQFSATTWAITFDDGPARTTIPILDALQKYKFKATFFVLSERVQNNSYLDIAQRILKEGHDIGSHSFTHPQLPQLNEEQKEYEIKGALNVLQTQLKVSPAIYRLPYGAGVNDKSVRQMLKEQNLIHVFWNVDTLDWADKDPESIIARTWMQMEQVKGGIILFHDIHSQSVVAATELLRQFYDKGDSLRLITVPQAILELNSGTR